MMIDYWFSFVAGEGGRGGDGRLHALLAVVAMNGNDNHNGDCLSKKGVGQGKRRGGIERLVCFFHAVLFCYCNFGLPFSLQVSWFLPLLLRASVTIVVKTRLVNSIKFFYLFLGSGSMALAAWRLRWQQRQHGGGGQLSGGGGSLVEACFLW